MPGDDDVLFFLCSRRDRPQLASLPRWTTLQRVVLDRLQSGEPWQGRLALADATQGAGAA